MTEDLSAPLPFLWLTARGLLALFGTIDRVTDGQIRAALRKNFTDAPGRDDPNS